MSDGNEQVGSVSFKSTLINSFEKNPMIATLLLTIGAVFYLYTDISKKDERNSQLISQNTQAFTELKHSIEEQRKNLEALTTQIISMDGRLIQVESAVKKTQE